jgi:hypothetical protein
MNIEEMKAAIDDTPAPTNIEHDGDAAMMLAEIATGNEVYDLDGHGYEEVMEHALRKVLEVRS